MFDFIVGVWLDGASELQPGRSSAFAEELSPVGDGRLIVPPVADGVDERLEPITDEARPQFRLFAFEVVVGDRLDGRSDVVVGYPREEDGDVVARHVFTQAGKPASLERLGVAVSEDVVDPVLRVERGGSDERQYPGASVGIVIRAIVRDSTVGGERAGRGRRPDVTVRGRRQATERAIVLVGREPAGDVDPVEQALARRESGERVRGRVAVRVAQKAGSWCIRRWSRTSNWRTGSQAISLVARREMRSPSSKNS
ncbi:hypothetical protein [Halosimplex amylolyticum]|uniref:hypothetical protein n=1 Tax=Halosimplex amylolyticum TaxID=3396616 RepID=UPI003F56E1EF